MTIITNKREYHLVMSEIEGYLQKGFDALSSEEEQKLDELSTAAESWELSAYPMPANPQLKDIIVFIMHQRGLNQTELSQQLKISKTLVSEILSGKKKPNLEIARQLHQQFHIDGNLILESTI
ncbi:MAG: helix-turn-helix domain-containing protein [Chitinophagaceae bacterium]|nr:helix-turn-helix domain-containing protein [Chitinophagaceae bacterium]